MHNIHDIKSKCNKKKLHLTHSCELVMKKQSLG
jgi:hypothetical protein